MKTITIPTTVRQAFKILDEMLSPKEKAAYVKQSKAEFSCGQHMGLGMWIRNNWMYGPDEEDDKERDLRDKCYRMLAGVRDEGYIFDHPDVVSGNFLERYHRHLRRLHKKA